MLSKSAMKAHDKGYRVFEGRVYREVKTFPNNQGYPTFTVRDGAKRITVKAHQLAAWQKYFFECIGKDLDIMHLDDNRLNFALNNLRLGTKSENCKQREGRKKEK